MLAHRWPPDEAMRTWIFRRGFRAPGASLVTCGFRAPGA